MKKVFAVILLAVALPSTKAGALGYGQDSERRPHYMLVRAQAQLPCANLYINNDTIKADVLPVADQITVSEIIKAIQRHKEFCFKGYVDDARVWQSQKHAKTDVLLAFTVGPLSDGNGVGPVGNRIEVVSYNIYAYNSTVNATVGGSPDIAWFAISKDDKLTRFWAYQTSINIMFAIGVAANDGVIHSVRQ